MPDVGVSCSLKKPDFHLALATIISSSLILSELDNQTNIGKYSCDLAILGERDYICHISLKQTRE